MTSNANTKSSGWMMVALWGLVLVPLEIVLVSQASRSSEPVSVESEIQALCQILQDRCEKKGFLTRATALEVIEGPREDALIQSWVPFINGRLALAFQELMGTSAQRKESLSRIQEYLKQKKWLKGTFDLKQRIPEFFLRAHWSWVRVDQEIQLSVQVVRLNASADFVEASRILPHPMAVDGAEKRKKWTLWALGINTAALLLGAGWIGRRYGFSSS